MKKPIHIIAMSFLSIILGCCEGGGHKEVATFQEKALAAKLAAAPQGEQFSLLYEIEDVRVKEHSQSISKEDSEVIFKIAAGQPEGPQSKGLERVNVMYDKYGLNRLKLGGDFTKGQTWELSFNKAKELIRLKWVK